jgi:hypothetical protein
MLDCVLIIAAAAGNALPEGLVTREPSRLFGLNVRDLTLLVGAAITIALVLFGWAYLTRRKARRHLSRSPRTSDRDERQGRREESDERGRTRKRRRQQPENLRRNPTLGETGGLPPIRPDEPAQPIA